MEKAARHILKGDKVNLEGQFHLDVTQAGPTRTKEKNGTSDTPQLSIVESNPEFTVIELICSCGTKTFLKCEYTDAKPSVDTSQTQNAASGADADLRNPENENPGTTQVSDQTK